jgi:hypothetical protein
MTKLCPRPEFSDNYDEGLERMRMEVQESRERAFLDALRKCRDKNMFRDFVVPIDPALEIFGGYQESIPEQPTYQKIKKIIKEPEIKTDQIKRLAAAKLLLVQKGLPVNQKQELQTPEQKLETTKERTERYIKELGFE